MIPDVGRFDSLTKQKKKNQIKQNEISKMKVKEKK